MADGKKQKKIELKNHLLNKNRIKKMNKNHLTELVKSIPGKLALNTGKARKGKAI